MRVSAITSDGDWVFGKGKASYKTKSLAIRQSVITRLRSFKNDWFLDMEFGNPWLQIFSTINNEEILRNAIIRSVGRTEGIATLDDVTVTIKLNRKAEASVTYTDLFNNQFTIRESIQ